MTSRPRPSDVDLLDVVVPRQSVPFHCMKSGCFPCGLSHLGVILEATGEIRHPASAGVPMATDAFTFPAPVLRQTGAGRRGIGCDVPVLHALPARGRPALLVLQRDALSRAASGFRRHHGGDPIYGDRRKHRAPLCVPHDVGHRAPHRQRPGVHHRQPGPRRGRGRPQDGAVPAASRPLLRELGHASTASGRSGSERPDRRHRDPARPGAWRRRRPSHRHARVVASPPTTTSGRTTTGPSTCSPRCGTTTPSSSCSATGPTWCSSSSSRAPSPRFPDQTVSRMVAGIDVILYRPDEELKRLARLAVDTGLDHLFVDGCTPESVRAGMAAAGRGRAQHGWRSMP